MDCEATSEHLPWLLNGSLEAQQAEQVRDHLAGCPRCRNEMEETRRAAAVFGAHLPTEAILDLAWDRPLAGIDPATARRHLDGCADCQEEMALARESRQLESAAAEPTAGSRKTAWRLAFLPAALAAGLLIGLWWDRGDGPGERARDQDRLRLSSLEAEVARLRGMVATLETVAPKVPVPQINLPVFEIFPGTLVRRGTKSQANEVSIPAGATQVALLLSADEPSAAPVSLAIEDDAGRQVWRGDGLVYGPPGGYVVAVPVELVPDGDYALTIRPPAGAAVVYRLRVRRAR